MKSFLAIAGLFLFVTCSQKDDPAVVIPSYYFPPAGSAWTSVTPGSLGWNTSAIADLKTLLGTSNTRALIVLKDGKIVIEEYLNTELPLTSTTPFTVNSQWYWASAGKTLTSALVGIANAQNKVIFEAKVSDYLGTGWSSCAADQEAKITVRNQLTMTTGLDDGVTDPDCTDKACLVYKADAGKRWAYHNAPYTLLDRVMQQGTGMTLSLYFNSQLRDKIGMDGAYIPSGYNNVFYSTPRSMARFGLLLLNHGVWDGKTVVPEPYFNLMTNPSQIYNLSYGYLTWLNGKASYMIPTSQVVIPGPLSPHAPSDMFSAMGKNGQLIDVVPSKGLVVIRVGDVPDANQVPFTFQDELWVKLNAVIPN